MANIAAKLTDNVQSWGVLGVVIVILSIVLLKFKSGNVGNVICSGVYPDYNGTLDLCQNASGTTALSDTGALINTFVTGLSEPKNWLIIVIIALIGFAVLTIFKKRQD